MAIAVASSTNPARLARVIAPSPWKYRIIHQRDAAQTMVPCGLFAGTPKAADDAKRSSAPRFLRSGRASRGCQRFHQPLRHDLRDLPIVLFQHHHVTVAVNADVG